MPNYRYTIEWSESAPLVGSTGALAPTEQAGEWTLSRVRPLDDNYQEDALDDPDSGWLDRSKIAGMLLVLRYELS